MNFNQLMEIVDAIGGVDIEIKDYELRNINSQIEYQSRLYGKPATYIDAPKQHLNGYKRSAIIRAALCWQWRFRKNAEAT